MAATTATIATIDLREPYRRQFMAHILLRRAANIAEFLDDWPEVCEVINGFKPGVGSYVESLDRLEPVVEALRIVADTSSDSLAWPFGNDELVNGMVSCVQSLREGLGDLPADRLEAIASAVAPAEAFLESLQAEDRDA